MPSKDLGPKGMPDWLYKALTEPPIADESGTRYFLWFWKSWYFGISWEHSRPMIRLGPLGVSWRKR